MRPVSVNPRLCRPTLAEAVAQACAFREDWFAEQILMAAQASTPVRVNARRIGALKQRMARLRAGPGTGH